MLYIHIGVIIFIIGTFLVEISLKKNKGYYYSYHIEFGRTFCIVGLIFGFMLWGLAYGDHYALKKGHDIITNTLDGNINNLGVIEKAHLIVDSERINERILNSRNHKDGFFSMYFPSFYDEIQLIDFSILLE